MTESFASLKIIIIVDGWTHNLFHECLSSSLLPEIQHEFIDHGILFSRVVSSFPSVSLSSHASILTGMNQNGHGIPGHRWMQLSHGISRNYIGASVRYLNNDIYSKSKTIFEFYNNKDTYSIQCLVNKGAKRKIRILTTNSERLLRITSDIACKNPDSLIVAWLPKGDGISHLYGPQSKEMQKEMIRTSRGLGEFAKKLRIAGLFKKSKILITSDHGQKEVKYHWNLAIPFRMMGYKVKVNSGKIKDCDVNIFTNGDSSAFIYFNNELFSKDHKYIILKNLANYKEVGLIFYRYDDFTHYIFSRSGISRITCNSEDINYCIRYEIQDGSDPLKILNNQRRYLIIDNLREKSIEGYYPDILHQYITSYVPGRSPDTIVTSSDKYHFGLAPRLGWRLGYHRGSHGGPSQEEMIFNSIIVNGSESKVCKELVRSKDLLHIFQEN